MTAALAKRLSVVLAGGVLGALATALEIAAFHVTARATLVLTLVIGIVWGTISAMLPPPLRPAGVVASALVIPTVTVMLGDSYYYASLHLTLDPLSLLDAIIWMIVLLPATIGFSLLTRARSDK